MSVRRIDDCTIEYSIAKFDPLQIHTSTQYATVYCNDRPMGTLVRKSAIVRQAHNWTIYDTEGHEVSKGNYVAPLLHALRRDLLS